MRRILSAAAALVLAFGVTVLTVSSAEATDSFVAENLHIFNNQPTVNFSGHLDQYDFVTGFSLQDGTDASNSWDIVGDCTSGIDTGSADPSGMDFTCNVPWSDADFPNTGTYTVTANIQHATEIVPYTATVDYEPGSYTDDYTKVPTSTQTFSPAAVTINEVLQGGADVYGAVETPGISLFHDDDPYQTDLCNETDDPSVCHSENLSPGVYDVLLTQSWTDNGGGPTTSSFYFYVASAPDVYVDMSYPSQPDVSGYGDQADDTISVSGPHPGDCSSTPVYAGEGNYFDCLLDGSTQGAVDNYSAVEISESNDEISSEFSPNFVAGGQSASTDFSVTTPTFLPSSSYAFTTGGIVTNASATGSADSVGIELYSLTPGEGYNYNLIDGCPALRVSEGEGGDELYQDLADGSSTAACTFPTGDSSTLSPGLYDVFFYENYAPDLESYDGQDLYFTVPDAPTVTSVTHNSNGTANVFGTGTEGDVVHAVVDGVASPVCAGTVSGGQWSCTTTAKFAGAKTFRAYQEDRSTISDLPSYQQGGLSAVSGPASVTLPNATTTTTTPPAWTFTITGIDLNNIHPGDKFTITSSGLPAGATITVVIHSTPVTLGTGAVASDGTYSQTITIPSDIEPGAHQILLTMDGTGLTETTVSQPLTVVPASRGGTVITTDPSKQDVGGAGGAGTTEHKGTAPGDPTAPNILTRSINTIQDVVAHPQKISAAVAIGLVLLVFATIPARLLNATIAEQYENIVKRVPRLGRRPRWWERFTAWLKATPLAGGIALTAATALLFGFADPDFGFNLASLRLIMGLAIALFIVEYLANVITGAILKRRLGLGVVLNLRPLGIILTIVGVIASRLLHFSPGFLIGLVLGLTLSGRTAAQNAWKAVMIRSGVVVGLGLVAWIGYSALTTGEEKTETFWTELFVEVLVAITTEGIVAILVELLPFRLLEGERLWHKNRWLWAVSYLVVLVAFIVAVVPWEGNWEAFGSSLWIWITAVAVFFAICIGLYLYFRFASPFRETEEEHEEDPVEVGGGG